MKTTQYNFIDPGAKNSYALQEQSCMEKLGKIGGYPEMDNTEVTVCLNDTQHCNAYQMNLEREYNSGKSARVPFGNMIYAELMGNHKNTMIKNFVGNTLNNGSCGCIDYPCSWNVRILRNDPEYTKYSPKRNNFRVAK